MSGKHLKIIDGGGETGESLVPIAIGIGILGIIIYYARKRKIENDTRRSNIRLADAPSGGSGTEKSKTGGPGNPIETINRILGDT